MAAFEKSLLVVLVSGVLGCGSSSSNETPAPVDSAASDADGSTDSAASDASDSADAIPDGGETAADASETSKEVPCTTLDDCTGATPRCDPTKKVCVGCEGDGDCRGGMRCYKPTGECRDCITDADCSPPTPYCDFSSSRQCTAKCTKDSDCPGPTGSLPAHCDKSVGVCFDCLLGSHCGSGFCELVTHSCVGCLKDTDCAGKTPVCGPSLECTGKCTSDAQCTGGLHCDTSTSACVECVTNKHCPGGNCQVDHTCG